MFGRPDTAPSKIEPLSWCFAVFLLFGSILYFLYFIFMWGVQNHGLTLQNWCINAAVSFGQVITPLLSCFYYPSFLPNSQDVFISEPIMIICIFILLFGKSKKEMRAIYHALNAVFLKYSAMSPIKSQRSNSDINTGKRATNNSHHTASVLSSIIQRICPACRVSRTETAKYLSFAQILRYVTGTKCFILSVFFT